MPGQSQRQILGRNSTAIITHTDQAFAAIGIVDRYTAGPSIQRIFDEFFDSRGGSLDNFTCRNAVYRGLVQLPDGWGAIAYIGVRMHHTATFSMPRYESTTLKPRS